MVTVDLSPKFIFLQSLFGMWRSLVAYTHGVRVVAGSNPVIPTNHPLG